MKTTLSFLLILLFGMIPTSAAGQDAVLSVEKSYCTYAFGYANAADMKEDLLTNAKRLAVNELFGELIRASTEVENQIVTSDQIRISSLGFVRITGDPTYTNGENLAEVCVTILAFVTADDLAQFEPVQLTKRLCQARPDLSAEALADFVKQETVIQALYDYDPRLAGKEPEQLLSLLRRISYRESGFLKDTTTYCVEIEGFVTPVEVLAFATFDGAPSGDSGEPGGGNAAVKQEAAAIGERMAEACATTLEFGQMVECALESDGQAVRHSFEAAANDRFVISVVRTSGDIQPWIRVYGRDGEQIPVEPDRGNRCEAYEQQAALAVCIVEKSGTYTIHVGSAEPDTSGAYRLDIQRLNNPGHATALDFGKTATGAFTANWESHYYTFTAEAGDRIAFDMVRTGGDIEPWLEVYGKDGMVIPIEPDRGTQCEAADPQGAQVICIVEKSGQYTIGVGNSAWDYVGAYSLDIQRLNAPLLATPIEFGEPIEETIDRNFQKRYFTFTGEAGEQIDIEAARTAGDIEPWLQVYRKDGMVIPIEPQRGNLCEAYGSETAATRCILEKSGPYTIVVGNNAWDYTGSFRLRLNRP